MTFELVHTWVTCGLAIVGGILPVHSYCRLVKRQKRKGPAAYAKWWSAEKRSATNREILTVAIWIVIVAFGLTAPLYALDKEAGGLNAMWNYVSFAGPCEAALVVGLGILKLKPHVSQPLTEVDFRYYFAGIPLLLLGYGGFLAKNTSVLATHGAWFMLITASAVPLVVRRVWHYGVPIPRDCESDTGLLFTLMSIGSLTVFYVRYLVNFGLT
ncbi:MULTISPECIES: hypothetical protein [unclassified Luteibacter]|uniref:hypothetical protein n=1 Tax=Luteibacter sp. PvP019 TaxID=3156436 RepID=UPI003391BFE1